MGNPFGGYGHHTPPPAYQPPPSKPNTLATLSIVFAFLFAPVGAVLGHVALHQIKQRQQTGRDRALVGLVLSYALTVVAVVALVVWAVLPTEKAPATASPPTATVSAPASTSTTTPTPSTPTPSAVPVTADNITRVLLDGQALSQVLDQDFEETSRQPPQVGGLNDMPNGLASETEATPHECVGATAIAQRSVYHSANVSNFAFQTWWSRQKGSVMLVDQAVIVLASPEEAEGLFADFSQQWTMCKGQTVTTLAGTTPDGDHFVTTATNVRVTDSVLDATVISDHAGGGFTRGNARALGVRGNCIVEVKVSLYGVAPGQDLMSGMDDAGVDVARAMMARIG
ncbi:hypothetical protein AWB99_11815 [Mycolicibacterium confluentis]|nr:hypothetical protein AWB99_11815 [Mycolicibacterium confluentis]